MSDEFKYKPTTAFWKIQKLIRDGLPKFSEEEQKVFVIQGGQGAGKTISILMLLIDYFNRNKVEITICSSQLTKVKDTVGNDFLKIMKDWNLYDGKHFNKQAYTYTKDTGHFVEFIGLDKDDVGKGRRRKIVYINESNKITLQQYTDITARADIVIMDFNPDRPFYGHDLINDFNYLNLTYRDNEYLSENEIRNILSYKDRGYNEKGDIVNPFWANKWRVYGLGEVGIVEGSIYNNWKRGTFPDTDFFIWGIDWGYRDPFTLSKFHINKQENRIYIENYCYQSNLNTTDMFAIIEKHVGENDLVVYDNARPELGFDLRNRGYNAYPCADKKGKVQMIGYAQNYELIACDQYTETELVNYIWADKRAELPMDGNDHILDTLLYVLKYYKINFL